MRDQPKIPWIVVSVLGLIAALIGLGLLNANRPAPETVTEPLQVDATSLHPGTSIRFGVGERDVEVSVPAEEGFTFGTFQIDIASLEYVSGPIERDGSLETVWVSDVNGDGQQDGVFLVRNGGSGSYVDIVVLESGGGGFSVRRLPSVSSATVPGYMGHDTVSVRNGTIMRSFPTYAHKTQVRIDRKWKPEDVVRGEAPIKVKPDSNADPSGATVELRFDYAADRWE